MKRVILLAVMTLATLPAHAAITIGALTQLCNYDAQGHELAPSSHASCQSYIAGIIDYHELYKSVGKSATTVDFCLPPALTYTDLQRIVLEYLQKSASYAQSPAAPAVVLSLRAEFPCDGGQGASPAAANGAIADPLAAAPTTSDVLNTPAQ